MADISSIPMEIENCRNLLACLSRLLYQKQVELGSISEKLKWKLILISSAALYLAVMKRLSNGRLNMAGVGTNTLE